MSDDVEARDGLVWLTIPDAYERDATNAFNPDYARQLGQALIVAADQAERQGKR